MAGGKRRKDRRRRSQICTLDGRAGFNYARGSITDSDSIGVDNRGNSTQKGSLPSPPHTAPLRMFSQSQELIKL